MELQDQLERLGAEGVRPYAIRYDSVETLSAFSKQYGIAYPLLSDVESRVIREFGILNTRVPEDHRWYGVPFPGTYMVDAGGVVFDKTFYADHVARDSITRMVQDAYHIDVEHGTVHTVETSAYTISAYLSADTIRRGQVHTLAIDLDIRDSYHVQAAPLPVGYVPFSVTIEAPKGVSAEPLTYPDAIPHRLPGLDDQLHIYDGNVTFRSSVLFNVRESVTLTVRIEAQACNDTDCLLPETHTFELSTTWLPNP